MATLVVEINDDLYARLQHAAAARGVTIDAVVTEALTPYLERDGFNEGEVSEVPSVDTDGSTEARKPRQAGSAKGMFIMGPDFDEPLEDFKDYM